MRNEFLVEVPGGKVFVRIAGKGDGVPLLTVHGGPGSSHNYLSNLEALGDSRQIVFYDQLGSGRSERPDDVKFWNLPRFLDELDCVVKALGFKRFHLFGHSWGTMLATDYILRNERDIASLILLSPCLSMKRVYQDMERLKSELPESVQKVIHDEELSGAIDSSRYKLAMTVFYRRHVCRLEEWPESLIKAEADWGGSVYKTMWGASEFSPTGNLKAFEREEKLHSIKKPTLLMCGRYDEMTPETTSHYARLFDNSEFFVFEQSAHVAHLEETEMFLNVVSDFLDKND